MIGSGNLVTNEEFISDFTSVDAASGFEVGISQSNSYKILVEADDNVMEYIEVGKSGDALVIGVNCGVDGKTGDVVELQERGRSFMGRDYTGELMLYPLAAKELYLEPYVSMLVRLNRELQRKPIWIVIGYSFNDPVIREIFIKNWSLWEYELILVHPDAEEIGNKKLSEIHVTPIEKYFGLTEAKFEYSGKKVDYRQVNHQIIHKLKKEPKFSWNQDPV